MNNTHNISLNRTLNSCLQLLFEIINIYKKFIILIEKFQDIIEKLANNQFNSISNVENTRQIYFNSIEILFNNITILLSKKIENKFLINFSTNNKIINGYDIGYYNFELERYIIFASIHSFNIKLSKSGVLKLIEYDNDFNPIFVLFFGSHFNAIGENDLQRVVTKAFNNTETSLFHIKTICVKYIQIYNNILTLLE
jgi:hypothetical protein